MRLAPWCTLILASLLLAGTGCKMCASNDDYTYPVRQCGASCGDCDSCGSCESCSTGSCAGACGAGYYENCGHVRAGSAQGGIVHTDNPTPAEYPEEEALEVGVLPARTKS